MKNLFILVFCMVFNFMCHAQITFEKGYYISNLDTRIDGYIKNEDWKNNPTSFEFKTAKDQPAKIITLKYAQEFGFEDGTKYIRAMVNVDRSSSVLKNLSKKRDPDFNEEEQFLNILVEGAATLYRYEDGNLKRYFYSINNKPIKPLVYKEYMEEHQDLKKNEAYKQVLYNNFKCDAISLNGIEKLQYKSSSLARFFIKYNTCKDPEYINTIANKSKTIFHLSLRPGVKNASLDIKRNYTIIGNSRDADIDNAWSVRAGLEAELVLPFNKNKWSIIAEPTYQYYKSDTQVEGKTTLADYKSIELPVGVRHYFFLNDVSKIFINASFAFDFPFSSTITYSNGFQLDLKSRNNLALGAGFNYGHRYSIEFRYDLDRNVLSDYINYTSNYGGISLILGYTLF